MPRVAAGFIYVAAAIFVSSVCSFFVVGGIALCWVNGCQEAGVNFPGLPWWCQREVVTGFIKKVRGTVEVIRFCHNVNRRNKVQLYTHTCVHVLYVHVVARQKSAALRR